MTEVKYFDEMLVLAYLVVDQNGAVQQLTDARAFAKSATHAGKASQQLHVVEQRVAETRSSLRVIFSDVVDDLSEIV